MTAVEQVLEQIREIATDEHDKGDRFERLMLHALQTDRTFQQQFTHVWRWMDWPERSSADIGVDLVARDAEGRLIAIQCKCYAPTATLTKDDIDSFVATSAQGKWSRRIIVSTTDYWSANAERTSLSRLNESGSTISRR
jgi:predicted helicase